jgi:hypothetical protein
VSSVEAEAAAAYVTLAVGGVDHEEAVAFERQVERIPARRHRAGGEVDARVGGRDGVLDHAGEDLLALEAGGADVGQVVGQHLLPSLEHGERGGGAGHSVDADVAWRHERRAVWGRRTAPVRDGPSAFALHRATVGPKWADRFGEF